jgi:hypothetical protein
MQENQDKETSTGDVQSTLECKKNLAGVMDVCVVCCK